MDIMSAIKDEDFKAMIANAVAEAINQKTTVGRAKSYLHGVSSLFGGAQIGFDSGVISTLPQWRGLGDILPRVPTQFREVFLPFVTGVSPTSATEQSTECGNCISGETTACIQHIPSARICRETKQMVITRIIDRLNNGDINLQLLNEQLGSPWNPSITRLSQMDLMQIATAWALIYELPPLFAQKLAVMMYTGNPANNIGEAYREFRGLESLVNTGFVDAFTNVACPGLNSVISDFNYAGVSEETDPSFFNMLEMAHYSVTHNADAQSLSPVEHVVVMRPELWQIVSQLVPIQRIQMSLLNWASAVGVNINFSGAEIVNERDQMRQMKVIPLNGEAVRVVTDFGITQLDSVSNPTQLSSGEFASDVYILPVKFLGNRDALQWQYKDYRSLAGEIEGTNGLINGFYRYTDDGMFAWAVLQDGACFKIQAYTEPRIVLRTPQLAARIENVKYTPLLNLISPNPDSPYSNKGGVSWRSPGTYGF